MVLSDRSIREEITRGCLVIDSLDEDCTEPSSVDPGWMSRLTLEPTASYSYQEFERNPD